MYVCIIGGGVAGFTLACHLEKRDIPYTIFVLENDKSGGYGLTIKTESQKILSQIGISFDETEINDLHGFVCVNENMDVVSETRHNNGNYVVARGKLVEKLRNKINQSNIVMMNTVDSIVQNNNHVTVKIDGQEYTYNYLIGADGINSNIRKMIGITNESCIIDTNYLLRIYEYKDGSRFHTIKNDVIEYVSNDEHKIRIFVKPCDEKMTSAQVFFRKELSDKLHDIIPKCFKDDFKDGYYENKLRSSIDCDFYRDDFSRVILIGDAHNGMVPYNGNGANTAIMNCSILAEMIPQNDDKVITKSYYDRIKKKTRHNVDRSFNTFQRAHTKEHEGPIVRKYFS